MAESKELTKAQVDKDMKLLLKSAPWITVAALRSVAFRGAVVPDDPEAYLEAMAEAYARVVPLGAIVAVVKEAE